FDLGRELYDRIASLGKHVDGLGKALTNAVSTYNRTVGSLESRVLVTARKLNEVGLVEAELSQLSPVEDTVRSLSAAELIVETGRELVTAPSQVRDGATQQQLFGGGRAISAAG